MESVDGHVKLPEDVYEAEEKYWRSRRDSLDIDQSDALFGIALSGGGVRSATLSAGFVEVLKKVGIFYHVDYLSTVSGGGFLGGYVHEKLRFIADKKGAVTKEAYSELLNETDLKRIRKSARYLAPGVGVVAIINAVVMAAAYIVSTVISLVWLLSLMGCILVIASLTIKVLNIGLAWLLNIVLMMLLLVLSWHVFMHWMRNYRLFGNTFWSSIAINFVESILAASLLVLLATKSQFIESKTIEDLLLLLILGFIVLFISGIFSNPNVLTMHRYYRDRLASAFLNSAHPSGSSRKLCDLHAGSVNGVFACGPYPLINTCLNLAGKDGYAGHHSSDYFLLSPFFCGAKLVGYVRTNSMAFRQMTLATAIAASGAALNPGMGVRSSKFKTLFLGILNLRLGYWVHNPKFVFNRWMSVLSPWWYYQASELLSRTSSKIRFLNISDGGFVDNLGVMELLHRRCKVIVVLDATADPEYRFSDLTNVLIRARNEIGLNIKFRNGHEPENVIRPKPSTGFSESHFSIADVTAIKGNHEWKDYSGLLIFVKSSMLEQKIWQTAARWTDKIKERSYHYKAYHAAFPHESTINQFFDEVQWEAYYELGRHLAAALVQVRVDDLDDEISSPVNVSELIERWRELKDGQSLLDFRITPHIRA